ncbi:MAG: helix-turn-helix domain-containing protein [Candidatus Eisenbacteria sp.]|nr:helix-turn-helix domain-containing protein [Candidatus Eisenbacteria bacterium]
MTQATESDQTRAEEVSATGSESMLLPMEPWRPWFRLSSGIVSTLTWASLSSSAKAVLVVLAYHANQERVAWPSVKKIQGLAGTSRRSTYRALAELESLEILEKLTRGRCGRSTRYRLLHPEDAECLHLTGCQEWHPQGAKACTHRVPLVAPETEVVTTNKELKQKPRAPGAGAPSPRMSRTASRPNESQSVKDQARRWAQGERRRLKEEDPDAYDRLCRESLAMVTAGLSPAEADAFRGRGSPEKSGIWLGRIYTTLEHRFIEEQTERGDSRDVVDSEG